MGRLSIFENSIFGGPDLGGDWWANPAPPYGDVPDAPQFAPSLPPYRNPRPFARCDWDPSLIAWAVAGEFATIPCWHERVAPQYGYSDDKTALGDELKSLLEAAKLRKRMGEEIAAQAVEPEPYFLALLQIGPSLRPATYTLSRIGLHVGGMVASYFKLKFSRARPYYVFPMLQPMLLGPPHASFPNGHALQSMLRALCLGDAVPDMKEALRKLAKRIGRNREIAGVHWPTDTDAGLDIAEKVFGLLSELNSYQEVVERARAEPKLSPLAAIVSPPAPAPATPGVPAEPQE